MKVLVINADCVTVNTSANLCHLAYLDGLVRAGHEVELLCADSIGRNVDSSMKIPGTVPVYAYPGMSIYEKLSIKKRGNSAPLAGVSVNNGEQPQKISFVRRAVRGVKKCALSLYGVHGIYSTFVRKAMAFKSDTQYDFVLSLSTPAASHLLAYKLLKKNRIHARHWIQIWEDPWSSDAYGFNGNNKILREEKRLLAFADKVCYVSPMTLCNQQKLFPESAEKMFWEPLPYYYKGEAVGKNAQYSHLYGYFGAYYPASRDLRPFYEAAVEAGVEVNICGDPAELFQATEQIHIHARLSLKELKPIEDKTNVLIFLCNRQGGQIPGKIYQYSATTKTILFILDGTVEEQKVLRDYFGRFNRYVFCQNTREDILRAIRQIEQRELDGVRNESLDYFNPVSTVNHILTAGGK